MAAKAPLLPQQASTAPALALHNIKCVKELAAESTDLNTIPSTYAYFNCLNESTASDHPEDSLPVIDFSLFTSDNPDQRSKIIDDLDKACQEWGFFMVVNHGIPETLMKTMFDACNEFFNMSEEEKRQFEEKHVLDPIRYGTSFNASKDKIFFWRDFLKVIVHPEFHCPSKPQLLSEILPEYSQRAREVARNLLKGLSESLGLEDCYMHKALNLDSGLQIFVANYYPPCPQPELAIGMPPHSDHGLLTMLIENEVGGLQIQHKGKWIDVNTLPNAILVNVGDHLEIFSNGRYKSVLHRAIVNNNETRMSLVFANGPSLDATVSPSPQLVLNESCVPAYIPMKYKDYLELQQSSQLKGKSCLDRVKNQVK